jgi:exopolyphosphatase/guanosine-5'-triphosphate,3'-diphosphate pyrophosphatase
MVTADTMANIEKRIMQFGSLDEVVLNDLRSDRWEILPAGYAITLGIMQAFELNELYFSSGALREGVIASQIEAQKQTSPSLC